MSDNKIFHLFYGWLDPNIPKDAAIIDKLKVDVKAAQDLADAHLRIDAEAEKKRRELHAETEAKKSALGISSGPAVEPTVPFVSPPVEESRPLVAPLTNFPASPLVQPPFVHPVVVPVEPLPVKPANGKKGF